MTDLHRRHALSLLTAAAAWPSLAVAQDAKPVIGFLNGSSYELSNFLVDAYREGLKDAGFVEGRNVEIEYRSADGVYDRLPALAADLVSRNVQVIAATGTPTGLPAKAATSRIPIVFVTGSDPVEQGLVPSLGHPGGNLTGATTLAVELMQKRMELLHELVPAATRVAALVNPKGPNRDAVTRDLAAAALHLDLPLEVVYASDVAELDAAFAVLDGLKVGALVIGTDTFFNAQSARLAALSRQHRLPSMYQYREFVAAGGLVSYSGSILAAYRLAGLYTGRILKGETPADLPVQQATKIELFFNLATARDLGLPVSTSLMARADELID